MVGDVFSQSLGATRNPATQSAKHDTRNHEENEDKENRLSFVEVQELTHPSNHLSEKFTDRRKQRSNSRGSSLKSSSFHKKYLWHLSRTEQENQQRKSTSEDDKIANLGNREYTENAKSQANDDCRKIVRFILKKNILCGDALTMLQADGSPIIFAEWSMVTDSCIKRRDYALDELLSINDIQINIFQIGWEFDEELKAYIPAPVREFPLTDYRSIDKYD